MSKCLLILEPSGQRILVDKKTTFLEAIRGSGLHIPSECGGNATCGKCKVIINPTPDPTEVDQKHLSEDEIQKGMRLACEHLVDTDSRAILVNTLTQARILEEGRTEQIEIIVDSDPQDHYGVAVDIGTTTIVAFLMDLVTGEQLASVSMLNPQIVYGEDIVTRLTSAAENSVKKKRLQSLVANSIEELVSSLINHSEIEVSEITKFSIVGNTAMHHFFLGLDTSTLAVAPYTPAQTKGIVVQSSKLGFDKIVADMYCA
ncbi:MAG: 2Fe-2S iron-sulfur cluster binding domain-containing protein, partial [Candidatus Thorarchaeota archaeon]|nr:2Fe-2S iron-sulfur cluster binding domain-containing protein [Candidatus Thorarchaeota archaeon]